MKHQFTLSPAKNLARGILVLFVCCLILFAGSAYAQYKIELQICEDLQLAKKQYGVLMVEAASCVNPTRSIFSGTTGIGSNRNDIKNHSPILASL